MRHIRGKDLNLLLVFDALWRERNVTNAAKTIGMTQPALSRALARLRVEFADPLFVRVARGVAPTDRAIHIARTIMTSLDSLDGAYRIDEKFDPRRVKTVVTIAANDYIEAIAATKLIPYLCKEAPGMTLNFRRTPGSIPKEAVEKGEVDLIIGGIFEQLPEGFFHQKIFTDRYRSAVRKDHPLNSISAKQFASLPHILVTPKGDLSGIIDEALNSVDKQRHVAIGTSSFFAAGWMLAQTDYILSAPGLLIDVFKEYLPIRDFPTPISVPKLDIYQIWHARTHQDPLHMWLRIAIQQHCK